jgi:hypothetical protein
MAAGSSAKFVRRVAMAIAVLTVAASAALAQETVDFSKLKKGDKLELKMGDQWVLVEFRKVHNPTFIITRKDGTDQLTASTMVRLPQGVAAKQASLPPAKPRTWTDRTGKFKIMATLVKVEDGKATLKRKSDGKEISVAVEKLADVDQKYLKSRETAATVEASDASDGASPAKTALPAVILPDSTTPKKAAPDTTQPNTAEPKQGEPGGN